MYENADYRHVFYAFNGPGPWKCHFCLNDILPHWDTDGPDRRTKDALIVHHNDHNKKNNAPENLKAAHQGCHARHHQRGLHLGAKRSDETRRKLSVALTGKTYRKRTEIERANISQRTKDYMASLSNIEKEDLYKRIQQNTDRTPILCACGAGPFKGSGAVKIHQRRMKCIGP